jgi:hypothetical protein
MARLSFDGFLGTVEWIVSQKLATNQVEFGPGQAVGLNVMHFL